jgi:hypothetical protein
VFMDGNDGGVCVCVCVSSLCAPFRVVVPSRGSSLCGRLAGCRCDRCGLRDVYVGHCSFVGARWGARRRSDE